MVVVSCIGLAYGSDLLVKNASSIARGWGISERVISITVIAVGTSLPELTASIIAAYKGEADISIGNIIGSNIFNILAVIGLTASIKSIHIGFALFKMDLIWMFGFTILLLFFLLPLGKKFHDNRNSGKSFFSAMFSKDSGVLLRSEAIVLFLGYILYIYLLF
jgi:cation:H+ antiporter